MAPSQPGAEAEGAAANNEKQVTVEAEGTGATKMEALHSAWMEAVRQGVGMFMASKTELVNDKLTEQIVTHSRGQVNAYQIVEERKGSDGWHLKIKARIDKDILQETAEAATNQKVAFDGKDLAAQKVTQQEKQKSAEQVWKEIEPLLDFRKCLKYRFTVEKVTLDKDLRIDDKEYKKGTDFIFGCHYLSWDLQKFTKQKEELEKLFEQVALQKETVQYENPNQIKQCFAEIKKITSTDYHYNWAANGYKDIGFCGEGELFKARGYSSNDITVIKNTAIAIRYHFGKNKDAKSIMPEYALQFHITNDEGLESIALYSKTKAFFVGATPYWGPRIAPVFENKYAPPFFFCHSIDCLQPLMDLTPEQLTNIKSLNAGYTLKRVTND